MADPEQAAAISDHGRSLDGKWAKRRATQARRPRCCSRQRRICAHRALILDFGERSGVSERRQPDEQRRQLFFTIVSTFAGGIVMVAFVVVSPAQRLDPL